MKRIWLFFAVWCSFTTALLGQPAEEKEVAAAVEILKTAMIDGNKASLENSTADNLSYGHSSGKVENKTEFVEALVSGKSDFVAITLTDQTIKITEHTAIVRHTLKAETVNNGTPGTANIHVLTVWVKLKLQWKLLARQAVKL